MSATDQASLISFLSAPVLVVDPDGHIIYVNPIFHDRFIDDGRELQGEHLAAVFEGGGREAILGAVAQVCDSGTDVHFRLMDAGRGYVAVASPIESDEVRVGVVVLLTDEQKSDQRLLAFHNQIQEPLDEVRGVLEDLLEQTGGRRAERFRNLVERGIGALGRVNKWSDELHGVLIGRRPDAASATLDPGRVVREVVAALTPDFESAGVFFDLLMPAQLPAVRGDSAIFESALLWLLRHRLSEEGNGRRVTLTARAAEGPDTSTLLVSVVETPLPEHRLSVAGAAETEAGASPLGPTDELSSRTPRVVADAVAALGGRLYETVEAGGRVTLLALAAVSE